MNIWKLLKRKALCKQLIMLSFIVGNIQAFLFVSSKIFVKILRFSPLVGSQNKVPCKVIGTQRANFLLEWTTD